MKYAGSVRIDFWVKDDASKEFMVESTSGLLTRIVEICLGWQAHFDHKVSISKWDGTSPKLEDVEFISETLAKAGIATTVVHKEPDAVQ